jgi:hypothetical protein
MVALLLVGEKRCLVNSRDTLNALVVMAVAALMKVNSRKNEIMMEQLITVVYERALRFRV